MPNPSFGPDEVDYNQTVTLPRDPNPYVSERQKRDQFIANGGIDYAHLSNQYGEKWKSPLDALSNTLENPSVYDRARADQSHSAQLALFSQMQGMPSAAGVQAQRALAQGASAALNAGGRGALGSQQALSAAGQGYSGALGALAQQSLAESSGRNQAMGANLMGLRGRDLQSTLSASEAQQRQRDIVNKTRLEATGARENIDLLDASNMLEAYASYRQRMIDGNAKLMKGLGQALGGAAGALGK